MTAAVVATVVSPVVRSADVASSIVADAVSGNLYKTLYIYWICHFINSDRNLQNLTNFV